MIPSDPQDLERWMVGGRVDLLDAIEFGDQELILAVTGLTHPHRCGTDLEVPFQCLEHGCDMRFTSGLPRGRGHQSWATTTVEGCSHPQMMSHWSVSLGVDTLQSPSLGVQLGASAVSLVRQNRFAELSGDDTPLALPQELFAAGVIEDAPTTIEAEVIPPTTLLDSGVSEEVEGLRLFSSWMQRTLRVWCQEIQQFLSLRKWGNVPARQQSEVEIGLGS